MTMSRIKRISNWGEWDELDGIRLEGGERLRIEWPNGRVTEETIKVSKGTYHYSDHGHAGEGPDWESYIDGHFNGVPVRVRLAGLKVQRV